MRNNNSKIIKESFQATGSDKKINKNNRSEANTTDQFKMTDCSFLEEHKVKTRIDYFTTQLIVDSKAAFNTVFQAIDACLNMVGIYVTQSKPYLKYFDYGFLLQTKDKPHSHCGSLKWRKCHGKLQLELTGRGCACFNTNADYFFPLIAVCSEYPTKIKRVDIALDVMARKHGKRFMQQAHSKGLYNGNTGRKPKKSEINSETGKTITIGSKDSTSQIIGYEKGKQLKLPIDSPEYELWWRYEVRFFGREGYAIPDDILFKPDEYFVGAYPKANRRVLKTAEPRSIKREALQKIDADLRSKIKHARHQIGPTIVDLFKRGLNTQEIFDLVQRESTRSQIEFPSYITKEDLKNFPFKG